MMIHSVNVSVPRTVRYRGKPISTGIFKEPVTGTVLVRRMGLDGDVQVDRRYHGGTNKAVYSYAFEHAESWQSDFEGNVVPGFFGENVTTVGLLESHVRIGDQYRIGQAILEAVQPRTPCFKLGIRVGNAGFVNRFRLAGKPGIYWKVIEEGLVTAGDSIELIRPSSDTITIHDIWRIVTMQEIDVEVARRLVTNYPLDAEWREPLEEMAAKD